MGVSGCGKSTVAARAAAALGWPFAEGDDAPPSTNVAAMLSGRALFTPAPPGFVSRSALCQKALEYRVRIGAGPETLFV